MRWPLRLQIMLPMAAVMLLTVVAVGGMGAFLAARATRSRIASQIAGVTQILEESNFPLTDAVLRQMKALSRAEMMLVDAAGNVQATSGATRVFQPLLFRARSAGSPSSVLGDRIRVRDNEFFHTALDLSGRAGSRRSGMVHILYPEHEYRRAWQRAVYPSLGFVAAALPVVMLLAATTASRISRRISRLQGQVDRIAEGDFRQMPVTERDDELRALSQAVNRMAVMLASYEDEIRHTERMRTLARLGGGMAHQLRNSATGCSMALDLHADECPTGQTCESLQVAKRQLLLMEGYVQRFLQLGKPADHHQQDEVDLAALVDDLLPLVQPAARHSGVALQLDRAPDVDSVVVGDSQELSQLVINLLLNAIEAAAHAKAATNLPGRVVVGISAQPSGQIAFTVSDSGQGPAEDVREHLFAPFVTEKADGIGLGLCVASDVAARHGGNIAWRRVAGMTQFIVELPTARARGPMCLAS